MTSDTPSAARNDCPDRSNSRYKVPYEPGWLGSDPSLYRPERWRPASLIRVNKSRAILIWPLVRKTDLSRQSSGDAAGPALFGSDRTVSALEGYVLGPTGNVWREVKDLRDHIAEIDPQKFKSDEKAFEGARAAARAQKGFRYAEFVYFYDFLQTVLFSDNSRRPDSRESVVRLFRRMDVKSAEIWLDKSRKIVAGVERCNLYLFATGAAALVTEFEFKGQVCGELEDGNGVPCASHGPQSDALQPLMLTDLETCLDLLRRTYVPFFGWQEKVETLPYRMLFLDETLNSLQRLAAEKAGMAYDASAAGRPMTLDEVEEVIDTAGPERTAPTEGPWRTLLAPLVLQGSAEAAAMEQESEDETTGKEIVWRHVVDERIPMMSFVSLTGADRYSDLITDASHLDNTVRLSEVKDESQRDLYTVSRGDWVRLCFADKQGSDPFPYSPAFLKHFEDDYCYDRFFCSDATTSASRIMFAGYHTCFVGAGGFYEDVVCNHFRRHYFQMALVLTMEHASILSLSSRVSALVREHKARQNPDADKAFRKGIVQIQNDFLEFVHIYRFTGVSNQLQPIEMFSTWRKSLGLDQMYDDVKEELEAAGAFALATEQADQSEAANRLSIVATFGVVAGLIVAALSMNLVLDKDLLNDLFVANNAVRPWREVFMHLFVGLGVVSFVTATAWRLMHWLNKPPFDRETEQILKVLRFAFLVAAAAFLLLVPAMAVIATVAAT